MRWLVNYIRSLFCKHEWELLKQVGYYDDGDKLPCRSILLYRCKKCGYVQKIQY